MAATGLSARKATRRVVLLAAAIAAASPAVAHDRHAGYYYPPPSSTETYKARALTLSDANRETRLRFVVGFTQKMLQNPYPPQFVMFAKGEEAEKLIIVSLRDGHLDTIYRVRALLALLTSVARASDFLNQLGVADFFTFFDLLKLLGFTRITVSDGADFTHRVVLE